MPPCSGLLLCFKEQVQVAEGAGVPVLEADEEALLDGPELVGPLAEHLSRGGRGIIPQGPRVAENRPNADLGHK